MLVSNSSTPAVPLYGTRYIYLLAGAAADYGFKQEISVFSMGSEAATALGYAVKYLQGPGVSGVNIGLTTGLRFRFYLKLLDSRITRNVGITSNLVFSGIII